MDPNRRHINLFPFFFAQIPLFQKPPENVWKNKVQLLFRLVEILKKDERLRTDIFPFEP